MRLSLILLIAIMSLGTIVTAQSPSIESGSIENSVALAATGVVPAGYEEPAGAVAQDQEISAESIAAELAKVESSTDLEDAVKKDCAERLAKAKEWLDSQREWSSKHEAAESEIAALPTRTAELREALAKPLDPSAVELPADGTIAQLESRLAEMRQQAEAADAEALEKQKATETRATRLGDLAKETLEVEKQINQAKEQISGLVTSDVLSIVKKTEQRARLRALEEKLAALKAMRRVLEATSELMPMERDFAVRKASASKKLLQRWQEAISAWRKQESQRQADQARRVAEQSHPALRSLAERNAEIAELRITTAAGIERIVKTLKHIDESSKELDEHFSDLRSKVEHAGTTSSTGILLRKQRDELPAAKEFVRRSDIVHDQMPTAHLRLMELKQWRREVAVPEEAASQLMQTVQDSLAKYDSKQVLAVINRLLSDRRDLLDKAIPDQDTYLRDLNELDLANQTYEQQVNEIREYLDQRILWMRSTEILHMSDIRQASQGLTMLLQPSRWSETVRIGVGDLMKRRATVFGVLALVLLVIMFRAKVIAKQERLCEPPPDGQAASFLRYAIAFVITFVISARWPILLLAIGYRLMHAGGTTAWTKSVGAACITTVTFVWGCELIREISRRNGVGEKLFGWSPKVNASIRGTLDLTLLVGAPLFAVLQLTQFGDTVELASLQRLLFITILLLCGAQIGWLVRPHGKLMTTLLTLSPDALVCRIRGPIWFFATAAPLAFATLSIIGYHFSAYQLSGRLAETGAAIYAMIVLYSLARCWLHVNAANRALVIAQQTASEPPESASGHENAEESPNARTITTIHEASREFQELLRYAAIIAFICGGWFIWSDVLPALRILDRVELWQNVETVAETVVGKDGTESIKTYDHTVPTTLTDVLTAIVICFGTVMVGRRLPGLLELTVLDRLPLDPGGHQAIAILVRYTATVAGLLFACHLIRLSWSSVQWLAAAMTVGLGFGLQEIFANLVSGIIILFERPIRAGDLVTVDDLTGHVTHMRMRATTITDYDRRELIVPNKRFITGNVVNWTLSDPITRAVLPVGVAYGSDVRQVQKILLRIARETPLVLSEPQPTTLFKSFGDSTLDVELRVFLPKREVYPDVVNDINVAIAREFKAAGIEIAFPQREISIRNLDAIRGLVPNQGEGHVAERKTAA